jgi:DNA-binding transcriptional LysR family regulator
MELRQLRYFIEVIDRGSFGAAASVLHLSQPALSKSVKSLEDTLKVPLLERTPAGVFATAYGRVLYEFASLIASQVHRVNAEITAMRGAGRGLVRIGCGSSVIRTLMPIVIRQFHRRKPDIDVDIRQMSNEEMLLALRRGEIDVLIATLREQDRHPELESDVIMDDHIDIVACVDHPLRRKASPSLKDLVPYRWVTPGFDEVERLHLHGLFAAERLPMPTTIVQTISLEFLSEFIVGTTHLSYVSRRLSGLRHSKAISPLPLKMPDWKRPIGISRRRGSVPLPAVSILIEEARKAGAKLDSGSK